MRINSHNIISISFTENLVFFHKTDSFDVVRIYAMADVTNLFKATVKALKSRNKALNENSADVASRILHNKKQESEFESKAKNLVRLT